ncbi:hypothetical protein EON83_02925 [bacterium]|nr:MAG: hypothetical protein EON83_02925 [bacterium]
MFNHNLLPRIPLLTCALLATAALPTFAQQPQLETAKIQRVALEAPTTQAPDRIDAPFELRNNLIYITAELNGKQKTFLIDSGAPALVLNADQLDAAQLKDSTVSAAGVGGTVRARSFHVDSFNWKGLQWTNFDTLAFPSPQRVNKDEASAGAIGYQLLKDYEITFDYGRKIITLIRINEQGNPVQKLSPKTDGIKVVPITMYRHVPALPMEIGGKTYRMGLDSGAGGNMLDKQFAPDLQKYVLLDELKRPMKAVLGGIGNDVLTSEVAVVDKATVGEAPYSKMAFVFTDGTLAQLNQGRRVPLDGLIGYEFLKQYVTSLNYKKGTLSIYTKGT